MYNWRNTKRPMRRIVHNTMRVPAYYISRPGAEPLPVDVRLHVKFGVGEINGTGEGLAAMLDVTPRIIFDRAEVTTPVRGAIVSVETGEAYIVGAVRPPDDGWITAEVAPLPIGQTDGLPVRSAGQ